MRKIDEIKEQNATALIEGIADMKDSEFERRMQLQRILNDDKEKEEKKEESPWVKILTAAIPALITAGISGLVAVTTTKDKLNVKSAAYQLTTKAELEGTFSNMSTKNAANDLMKLE